MDVKNEYGCLEMQKALLPLIKEFDAFCMEKKINYSLTGGSLLGAIRHKGFIPWDDDLDVMLDRVNYERLKLAIRESSTLSFAESDMNTLWIPRIRFNTKFESKGYSPTLDVFIMDYVPRNKVLAKLKYYGVLGCQGMIKNSLTLNKGTFILKICSLVTFLLGRCFTTKFKFRLYDRLSQLGDEKTAESVCWYNCPWIYVKFSFDKKIVEKYVRVIFEDTELMITALYDHFLSVEYGDYMMPPKMEHRLPKHLNNAYEIADLYINKSYR